MVRVLSILFITGTIVVSVPRATCAHAYLIELYPEESAEIVKAPGKIGLHFLGFLEHFFSKVEVFDSSGNKVSDKTRLSDGEDGTVMEAGLPKNLPAGVYTVKWTGISKDGHKQNGTYTFTIK